MWTFLALVSLLSLSLAQECGVGMTKVEGGYEYTCIQEEDGFLFWMSSGCVSPVDDSVQAGGSTFQDNFYVYECVVNEDKSVGLNIVGCVSSNGDTVEEGGTVEVDDYTWTCAKVDDYLHLVPSGCVVDGGEVPIGETFDKDGFWYTCSGPDPLVRQLGGCVSPTDGTRLNNGEYYFKNGFTVSCLCVDNSCTHQVTACEGVINGVSTTKSVSEEWTQGTAPFIYKMKCSTCSQGTTLVRTVPHCSGEGNVKIEPGCYTPGASPVACGINQQQTLQVISGTEEELLAQGFTAC